MPQPQTPLDPLPIPETAPVDVQPAQVQAMAGQPLPPQAGWVSPAGAGAYIASNILTGWMAGKHMAEQKKLDRAKSQVVGAKNVYEAVKEQYQDMVAQGMGQPQMDPTQPLDQEKIAKFNQAKANVNHAWQNYLNVAQQYSFPEGGEKKGFKEKAKATFMGQQPELFAQGSIDVLKKMDPTSAAFSSEDALRRQALQAEVKGREQEIELNTRKLADDADVRELRKQRKDAVANGDMTRKNQIDQQLASYGVTVPKVETLAQEQAAQSAAEMYNSGIEVLKRGGSWADLTTGQRAELGLKMGGLDAYMDEVGPGKKFKTPMEASQAYLADEEASRLTAGRSAKALEDEDAKRALRTVIEHDVQTPEGARKWGLTAPLQPGQKIPDYIFGQAWLEYQKGGRGKIPTEQAINKQLSTAIRRTVDSLPPDQQEQYKSAFVDIDPLTGLYSMKPYRPKAEEHKGFMGIGAGEDTIAGIPASQYDQKKKDFMARIGAYVTAMDPDANQELIMRALNSQNAAAYLQDNAAAQQPTTAAGAANQAQRRDYIVSDGYRQVIKSMTPQEADLMRQGNPGWNIQPSTALPATGVAMPRR